VQDVRKYVHGIARLVALERRRTPAPSSLEDFPLADVAATVPDDEHPLRDSFDRCLGEMAEENRSLILHYYEGQGSAKITNRRTLATTLGVTENALRSRVQRLRDRLEQCVNAALQPTLEGPS
jgi:DNA-directed RNA polymerase specialized sigma24 family protein